MAVYESLRGSSSCRPPASMAVMMMIVAAVILINANGGGAAVVVKSNVTYGCISGREEGCLIAEDLEVEWLMEYSSHVARVLAEKGKPKPITPGTGGPTNTPCNSGPGKPYAKNCSPAPKPKPGAECKDKHYRGPNCN